MNAGANVAKQHGDDAADEVAVDVAAMASHLPIHLETYGKRLSQWQKSS